jgi:hypothetical protein
VANVVLGNVTHYRSFFNNFPFAGQFDLKCHVIRTHNRCSLVDIELEQGNILIIVGI